MGGGQATPCHIPFISFLPGKLLARPQNRGSGPHVRPSLLGQICPVPGRGRNGRALGTVMARMGWAGRQIPDLQPHSLPQDPSAKGLTA